MSSDHHRYFIELYLNDSTALPRHQLNEKRREQAAEYIMQINDWLQREAMEDKVASMAITAMGQVQIICEADIINHLSEEDETHIAAIRHGAMFVESMNRWTAER